MAERAGHSLNIVHVLRTPVGGLFRHVVDLACRQAARGHRVGLIADASSGGPNADAVFADLSPALALGISRLAMSRQIGWRDLAAVRHVTRRAADVAADVVHGHGAKGGAYARLARADRAIRVYTPHGGSLHYEWASPIGFLYLTLERILLRRTDLILFESAYGRDTFAAKIGSPRAAVRVVHNGVAEAEFAPVETVPRATDLVFIGELRRLKGVDVLIDALAALAAQGRPITATIVGEGAERSSYEARTAALGLAERVRFAGALPARPALGLGRIVVIPSRAESLPYIVLEAGAAGRPLITTSVGGIPEIFGPDADRLVKPGDPAALARAIVDGMDRPAAQIELATRLQARIREHFSVEAMSDAILAGYADAFARRHG